MGADTELIQTLINRAVRTATRAALNGRPIERIDWVPPQSATEDPTGVFLVNYCGPLSASDTPPWEEQ